MVGAGLAPALERLGWGLGKPPPWSVWVGKKDAPEALLGYVLAYTL